MKNRVDSLKHQNSSQNSGENSNFFTKLLLGICMFVCIFMLVCIVFKLIKKRCVKKPLPLQSPARYYTDNTLNQEWESRVDSLPETASHTLVPAFNSRVDNPVEINV
jgi:hypothetical protein